MDDYKLIKLLGEGSKGKVYIAEMKDNSEEKVTIKIIHKNKTKPNIGINQIKDYIIPKLMGCKENIICIVDAFEDDDNYYILSEYYENARDLTQYNINTKSKEGFKTTIELLLILSLAIKELHNKGIAHRDIKLENILFKTNRTPEGISYTPIIIDFDLSCVIDSKNLHCNDAVGSPAYVPPEVYMGAYVDPKKADIYSLGMLFYELLNDRGNPYVSLNNTDLQDYVRRVVTQTPKYSESISPELNVLIYEMLNKNVFERPDIDYVIKILTDIISKY